MMKLSDLAVEDYLRFYLPIFLECGRVKKVQQIYYFITVAFTFKC